MKTYSANFKKNSKGVFAISLVDDPATQEHFIAMSKPQEIRLADVDKEQRIVMGLVLQPDQLIYRNQGGQEFNIYFSAETIKELSQNFLQSGFQLNSKLEHNESIEGVSFVESWLVENPKIDKSYNFGFEYPKGSWIATMKVDNDEIWNNYVKTGKVNGFSVDAMVDLQEIEMSNNNLKTEEMSNEKKSLLSQMEVWFTENILTKKKVEMGEVRSGEIVITYDGEELEVGMPVFVMSDEERISLPDGDYPTEIGLVIVNDGVVSEIRAEGDEEVDKKVGEDEGVEEELGYGGDDDMKKKKKKEMLDSDVINSIKSILVKYSEDMEAKLEEKFNNFSTELTSLKEENAKLKSEVTELSNQPASKPIVSKPATQKVALTRKGRLRQAIDNAKN